MRRIMCLPVTKVGVTQLKRQYSFTCSDPINTFQLEFFNKLLKVWFTVILCQMTLLKTVPPTVFKSVIWHSVTHYEWLETKRIFFKSFCTPYLSYNKMSYLETNRDLHHLFYYSRHIWLHSCEDLTHQYLLLIIGYISNPFILSCLYKILNLTIIEYLL